MTVSRHKIFDKFASRLGLYNGLLFQSKSHFNDIINIKKKWSKNKTGFFLGTHLTFRNYLKGGRHEFVHSYEVNRRNISKTVDVFHMHFSNFCIAQCFEAFETFLKDVIVLKIQKSPLTTITKGLKGKTQTQCRKNLEEFCHGKNKRNKKLFSLIKSLSLPSSTQIDSLLNQLSEWYIVFSEVRHSIVHSNGHLKKSVFSDWSLYQKKLLKDFMVKEEKADFVIINTFPNYGTIIQTIVMHGQLIYDRLDIPE